MFDLRELKFLSFLCAQQILVRDYWYSGIKSINVQLSTNYPNIHEKDTLSKAGKRLYS